MHRQFHARIGKNAVVANSAVMDRVIIGENAEVYDSIIGSSVVINSSCAKPTKISAVSVVADDVILDEGCSLATTKVYPHQNIRGEFQKPDNNRKLKCLSFEPLKHQILYFLSNQIRHSNDKAFCALWLLSGRSSLSRLRKYRNPVS